MVGAFNAQNLLGVLGVLLASDVPLEDAVAAIADLPAPAGRMQRFGGDDKPLVVVDYAHTPDALEKVLLALRPAVAEGGELVCVFGCGGDRDPGKRPQMGASRGRACRSHRRHQRQPAQRGPVGDRERDREGRARRGSPPLGDRERSPRRDCAARSTHARRGDVVLIAGKGHETYQERGGERTPFSDAREAASRARRLERGMMDTVTAARVVAGRVVGGNVPLPARDDRQPHAARGRSVRRA